MITIENKSRIKPLEWDLTSSPTTIYHNYDIKENTDVDDDNLLYYEYLTDKYTILEYQSYLTSKQETIEAALIELAALLGEEEEDT